MKMEGTSQAMDGRGSYMDVLVRVSVVFMEQPDCTHTGQIHFTKSLK